ncbi:MAG TPA: glycosyltransferase, partial [Candidatus Baltobacteraceae bacterium]
MTLHAWDEPFPLVTTIITSYNYARFLPAAIESALEQDYPNHEVLILDNCSTDNSREIIERYTADARVRAIFNESNLGLIGNYNRGLEQASGTYIVLLSADDLFFPGHLRRSIEYYRSNPQTDLMYTPYYIIDASGAVLERSTAYGIPNVESYADRNEFADLLQYDNYMYLPSILVNRNLYEQYGGFATEIPVAADYEICLRWIAAGKRFGFLNEPAVAMRRHASNRSGDAYVETGAQLREHVWILDKYINEEHAKFYAGREGDIVSMLQAKITNLRAHREVFDRTTAHLEPRIQEILERMRHTQTLRPPAPLVSVIVPCSGDVLALRDALTSIAAQSYENWEAVIVQDGGASIESFLRSLAGAERFRYARRMLRSGAAAARNDAIRLARGDIIAYLDEGNLWQP